MKTAWMLYDPSRSRFLMSCLFDSLGSASEARFIYGARWRRDGARRVRYIAPAFKRAKPVMVKIVRA